MILLFLDGGIIIAKNIPYKDTLKALVILPGKRLPAMAPKAVPTAQHGPAMETAPYV